METLERKTMNSMGEFAANYLDRDSSNDMPSTVQFAKAVALNDIACAINNLAKAIESNNTISVPSVFSTEPSEKGHVTYSDTEPVTIGSTDGSQS